ncbi:MAG: uncharacterized protein KVP18_001748 [Porospora cf. gigantea A]|uniref:uncharacterized protein n=1 Tax=Porospora cf. gigantea A TaxID=2853593 RepID=UPI003559AFEA|nr:MAG: hypothetical protein KVP18_001748 [Porospora cf. gigantea A]
MGSTNKLQGYRFSSVDLTQIIREEWDAAKQKPPGYVNLDQAVSALQRAFRRLTPVVPLPTDHWCKGVFQNFDKHDLGVIDVKCFRRIVEQTHDHYATKNEEQAKASMCRRRGRRQTYLVDEEKANPKKANVPQEPGTPVLGFRSQIQFPRDEDDGLAKMLTDYDLVDKSVGKGSFGTVQRVRCRRTGEIFCAKEIGIKE